MEGKVKQTFKEKFTFVSTVISWTIFTLLIICAVLLFYYFVSMRLYAAKGDKFEPKFSLYTIISASMVPNIKVYDVIINLRVDSPKDIKIDDVITFKSTSAESSGKTVTHRVVSIIQDGDGNYSYQTKGDNNLIADSSPVAYSNVIGKVALKLPQLGRVQMFVASAYGWLCLILLPALYIIFKDVMKILKLSEKFKDHKILGKKLLIGRRPKLLPEPKLSVGEIPNDYGAGQEKIPVQEPTLVDKSEVINNVSLASELPVQEENDVIKFVSVEDKDSDDDEFDLPDLK